MRNGTGGPCWSPTRVLVWLLAWMLALPPALIARAPAGPAAPGRASQDAGQSDARTAAVEQAAIQQEALARIRAHRQALRREISSAASRRDAAALQVALAQYRQTVTAELLLEAVDLEGRARLEFAGRRVREARERYNRLYVAARASIVDRLPAAGSEAARQDIYASVEDALHAARAELEMAQEALRRVEPLEYISDLASSVNRTQRRLWELLDRLSSTYAEDPLRPGFGTSPGDIRGPSQAERQAEHWLRQHERDADVAEYVRLARGGVFVDPDSGAVIEGIERQRIALNAERQLVEALRRANLSEGVLARLMGFADTRADLAAERDADISASDEYRALGFLRPNIQGSQAREVFVALALAVRHEQSRIHDWRAQRIPEGGQGGITGWLYENFVAKQQVGVGLASEIGDWGLTRDSLEQIDRRIAIFQRDADAVVEAFEAAARTPTPRDLLQTPAGGRAYELLERYGYIVGGSDGTERYEFPTDARVSARLGRDLNLPGSSWLDIISGANFIKLVILAAAPELAAARVGALLGSLEVGGAAVTLGRVAVDVLAGTAIDAGFQLAEGRTIEADRLAIETLFLAPAILASSRLAGEASGALAALLRDPSRREAAEKFLFHALGLASDASLLTYWQARLQGEISYEDFLANLINGAISRSARGALHEVHGARAHLVESIRGYRAGRVTLPEALGALLAGSEAQLARVELLDRAQENQRRFDEAVRDLRNIIGDDLTHLEAPTRLVRALEDGRYSWADLKMLYRNDPAKLEPLMKAANEARARFSERIVATARIRAREQIEREYNESVRRLNEALGGTDQLQPALDRLGAWRERQLELLQQDPFAPGSRDLTSDIDRSVASPYFRNQLKRLTDEAFVHDGRRLPPTSARAYDLNEYIDVFPVVRRTRSMNLTPESPPGFGALNHHQAVETASLSAAMLHMTPAQRARFRENALRAADPTRRRTLEQQFDYAEQSLRRGEQELQAEIDRLVAQGADRNSPDTIVRARDNLYGERTRRLGDMEWELSRLDPNSPEARRLAAEIELEWAYTLREGIETYSTFPGLEVIVMHGQLQDRSIRDLINDPRFTAEVLNLSPEQARAMLNDQVLMIVEHVHAFHHGHESGLDAAAALGKYAERAVLALKLVGADLSSGPLAELNRVADVLVQARKDPARLRGELERYGDGNADQALVNLSRLLERTVPALDGVLEAGTPRAAEGASSPGALTAGPTLAQVRAQLARQREREQELERERVYYGAAHVAETIGEEIERMERELALLRAEQARVERLRASYRRQDWARAVRLENERASLDRQLRLLPDQQWTDGVAAELRRDLDRANDNLSALERRGLEAVDSPAEADERRERRIAHLEEELGRRRAELRRREDQAQEEARMAEARSLETQVASAIDVTELSELERAGLLLFGDLDPTRIVPADPRPDEPVPAEVTPRPVPPAVPPARTPPPAGPAAVGAAPGRPDERATGLYTPEDWERQAAAALDMLLGSESGEFVQETFEQALHQIEDFHTDPELIRMHDEYARLELKHLQQQQELRERQAALARTAERMRERIDAETALAEFNRRAAADGVWTPEEIAESDRLHEAVMRAWEPTAEERAQMDAYQEMRDAVVDDIRRLAVNLGGLSPEEMAERAQTARMFDAATRTWRKATFSGTMVDQVHEDTYTQREVGIRATNIMLAAEIYLNRTDLTDEQREVARQIHQMAHRTRGYAAEAIAMNIALVMFGTAADIGTLAVGRPAAFVGGRLTQGARNLWTRLFGEAVEAGAVGGAEAGAAAGRIAGGGAEAAGASRAATGSAADVAAAEAAAVQGPVRIPHAGSSAAEAAGAAAPQPAGASRVDVFARTETVAPPAPAPSPAASGARPTPQLAEEVQAAYRRAAEKMRELGISPDEIKMLNEGLNNRGVIGFEVRRVLHGIDDLENVLETARRLGVTQAEIQGALARARTAASPEAYVYQLGDDLAMIVANRQGRTVFVAPHEAEAFATFSSNIPAAHIARTDPSILVRIDTKMRLASRGNPVEWTSAEQAWLDRLARMVRQGHGESILRWAEYTAEGLQNIFRPDFLQLFERVFGATAARRAGVPAAGTAVRPPPPATPMPPSAPPRGPLPPPAPPAGVGVVPGAAGTAPDTTTLVMAGGFVPTTAIPTLAYGLEPRETDTEPEPESFVALDSPGVIDLVSSPGFAGGAGSARPGDRNPVVQKMMIDLVADDAERPLRVATGAQDNDGPIAPWTPRRAWTALLGLLTPPAAARGSVLGSTTGGPRPDHSLVAAAASRAAARLQGPGNQVQIYLTSLGVSSGEAFDLQIISDGQAPIEVFGQGVVVEPLTRDVQQRLQRELQQQLRSIAGRQSVATRVTAYCLEFLRQPPSAGMMFRIAGPELQREFAPMRRILQASRRLQQAGLLSPDSDPTAYFHSIRQWAVWTREQGFDLQAFGRAFVDHTKTLFEEAGREWSSEVERVLLDAAPGRWRDIQLILEEAERTAVSRPIR